MGVLGMFAKQSLTQESLQAMASIANGIGLAISQRRHEEQIQHYQEIQHMILQSTQDGMYGLDLEGKTTFVNRMAAEWLGWAPEELIGRSQHALIHHTKSDGSPFLRRNAPFIRSFRMARSVRCRMMCSGERMERAFPWTIPPARYERTMEPSWARSSCFENPARANHEGRNRKGEQVETCRAFNRRNQKTMGGQTGDSPAAQRSTGVPAGENL